MPRTGYLKEDLTSNGSKNLQYPKTQECLHRDALKPCPRCHEAVSRLPVHHIRKRERHIEGKLGPAQNNLWLNTPRASAQNNNVRTLVFSSKIYKHSPRFIQECMISSRSFARRILREGKTFKRYLDEALKTEHLDTNGLRQYQTDMFCHLIRHAYENVPFYREILVERGLSPSDFKDLDDVEKLPILKKTDIAQNTQALYASNVRKPHFKGTTSGTTGRPLTLYQDLEAINRENAFLWRQLLWAGFQRGDRRAWIRGDAIIPPNDRLGIYWRRDWSDNMLMMSSYHLSEQNAPRYIDSLTKFDPAVIQAFPSSIAYLANFLRGKDRYYEGKSLKSIVTSSETLSAEQREVVEERFGCRIYDWYGNFERVSAIGTCEHGNYHVMSDYSLTELIPKEDGTAEIIGTGFNNKLMPLFRYQTEDSVILKENDYQCPCGRAFPVIDQILGRKDDILKTPDGREIPRGSRFLKYTKNIAEGQIIQERLDEIKIRLVPLREFSPQDEKILLEQARDQFGPTVRIVVEVVDHIPRTSRGKLKPVISKL